jgi:hypothetical protein
MDAPLHFVVMEQWMKLNEMKKVVPIYSLSNALSIQPFQSATFHLFSFPVIYFPISILKRSEIPIMFLDDLLKTKAIKYEKSG